MNKQKVSFIGLIVSVIMAFIFLASGNKSLTILFCITMVIFVIMLALTVIPNKSETSNQKR